MPEEQQFYRIGEVASILGVKTSVLRFWEAEFPGLEPERSAKGQRYYTARTLALLRRIKDLLHRQGMTIDGAKRMLREEAALSPTELRQAALLDRHCAFFAEIAKELVAVRRKLLGLPDVPAVQKDVPVPPRRSEALLEASLARLDGGETDDGAGALKALAEGKEEEAALQLLDQTEDASASPLERDVPEIPQEGTIDSLEGGFRAEDSSSDSPDRDVSQSPQGEPGDSLEDGAGAELLSSDSPDRDVPQSPQGESGDSLEDGPAAGLPSSDSPDRDVPQSPQGESRDSLEDGAEAEVSSSDASDLDLAEKTQEEHEELLEAGFQEKGFCGPPSKKEIWQTRAFEAASLGVAPAAYLFGPLPDGERLETQDAGDEGGESAG